MNAIFGQATLVEVKGGILLRLPFRRFLLSVYHASLTGSPKRQMQLLLGCLLLIKLIEYFHSGFYPVLGLNLLA